MLGGRGVSSLIPGVSPLDEQESRSRDVSPAALQQHGVIFKQLARRWEGRRGAGTPRGPRHEASGKAGAPGRRGIGTAKQEQKARSEKPRAFRGPRAPPGPARGGEGTVKLQLLLQGP